MLWLFFVPTSAIPRTGSGLMNSASFRLLIHSIRDWLGINK
jgi:hypothetical protein